MAIAVAVVTANRSSDTQLFRNGWTETVGRLHGNGWTASRKRLSGEQLRAMSIVRGRPRRPPGHAARAAPPALIGTAFQYAITETKQQYNSNGRQAIASLLWLQLEHPRLGKVHRILIKNSRWDFGSDGYKHTREELGRI